MRGTQVTGMIPLIESILFPSFIPKKGCISMNRSFWKRATTLAVALLMIAAFGCGKSAVEAAKNATTEPETISIGEDAASGGYGNNEVAEHTGVYSVDGTTEEITSGSYASSAPYENTVLVQNAGQLKMTSADINKTGDAKNDFSNGINAAVAAKLI